MKKESVKHKLKREQKLRVSFQDNVWKVWSNNPKVGPETDKSFNVALTKLMVKRGYWSVPSL